MTQEEILEYNKRCDKNGIKKEGESCTLNNNCIYPNCMNPTKQTVYLPVKVEDDSTFLITKEISNYLQCNSSIDFHKNGKCTYTPVFITETSKESEELEHLIIERLDKKEGYFFTPEELNEYTANIIKQTLETAAEKAEIDMVKEEDFRIINRGIVQTRTTYIPMYNKEREGDCEYWEEINKQSITNTFEETFKRFEV